MTEQNMKNFDESVVDPMLAAAEKIDEDIAKMNLSKEERAAKAKDLLDSYILTGILPE